MTFDPSKLPDSDFRVPDEIGTVTGWRAWGVPAELPKFGVAPKLYSVTYGEHYWTPRKIGVAACERGCMEVPDERCSCGFYSAKTLPHLLGMSYHRYDAEAKGMFHVVGKVANWGKIVEGTQGWRSEKAYPVALFIPFEAHRLARPLSAAYGIPVRLKNILNPIVPTDPF
jgi:hypothetical protein